jgi:UDP-3-O-[3-hydroxymyristoyl] glucosamine N-acyltransferase
VIRAYEIVDFLRGEGELVAQPALPHEPAWEAVTGIRRLEDAGAGDLCWISEKNYAVGAWQLPQFNGGLLLGPPSAAGDVAQWPQVVACRSPKVAFSKVVWRFFAALCDTRWCQPDYHGVVRDGDSVIPSGSVIGPNTVIAHARIGQRVVIGANCTIGLPGFGYERDASGTLIRFPHTGRVLIGDDVEIGSNTCIDRGALGDTVIEDGAKMDNLVHVAHNVRIGKGALVIAHAMLGGSVRVGERAWIAPAAAILNQRVVHDDATVGMGAVVLHDVAPHTVVVGNPAHVLERKD